MVRLVFELRRQRLRLYEDPPQPFQAACPGASGQNFYMLHGGSNFDSWNDNETAASYDYGTIIGQAGDLRPVYFSLKANNLFATSFSPILDNATLAIDEFAISPPTAA